MNIDGGAAIESLFFLPRQLPAKKKEAGIEGFCMDAASSVIGARDGYDSVS
jgi:hypothetical protein